MAYLYDFVCEIANAPGTSTVVSLLGAAPGIPVTTFSGAGVTTGSKVFYTITDGSSISESGVGTYSTSGTLSRDTVKANTSGTTARLNFTGQVFVFSYAPAALSVILDETLKCSLPGGLAVTGLADFSVGGAKIAAAPQASDTAPLRADQSWQVIAKYPMAAVGTQTILLPTTFSRFRLTLQNLTSNVNGVVIFLRFSTNGGTSFITTGSYATLATYTNTTGATGAAGGGGVTSLTISHDLYASPSSSYDASMEIWPGTAARDATLRGTGVGVRSGGPIWGRIDFAGGCSTGLMNACQIFPGAIATMSGTAIVEGLP